MSKPPIEQATSVTGGWTEHDVNELIVLAFTSLLYAAPGKTMTFDCAVLRTLSEDVTMDFKVDGDTATITLIDEKVKN